MAPFEILFIPQQNHLYIATFAPVKKVTATLPTPF